MNKIQQTFYAGISEVVQGTPIGTTGPNLAVDTKLGLAWARSALRSFLSFHATPGPG